MTGIDKVRLNCDCIFVSIVNAFREPILFSFGLNKRRGYKIYKKPGNKLLKMLNKPVLSHITFYLEDDN